MDPLYVLLGCMAGLWVVMYTLFCLAWYRSEESQAPRRLP